MMLKGEETSKKWVVFCCFVIVYLVWGSTFLAIRLSVETVPPLLVGGFRHFFGGFFLFLALYFWSPPRLALSSTRNALLVGSLTAGIANGCLIVVEKTVPSSIAAVSFTAMPVLMLLLNWIAFEKIRPTWLHFAALLVGIVGTTLVLMTGRSFAGTHFNAAELALLICCPLVWAFGSLLGRRITLPKSNLINAALQMIGGGLLLFALGTLHGDWPVFKAGGVTATSVWSVVYLTFFGSLLGYSAFAYLMKNVDSQLAGTYAFINPVVAVGLGLLWGEKILTPEMVIGSTLAILSVATIVISTIRKRGS